MKKILFLLLILLLTGCSNYRELTDIAITTAISVDYNAEAKEYTLITQVVNSANKKDTSSSNEPTFLNFTSTSTSLSEALSKIVLESPRKLYTSQTEVIILSKEIIENKLNNVLDYFIRNPEIRGETLVLLAPDKKDLKGITIQTLLDNLSSSNIVSSLKESEKEGYTFLITLNDLTEMHLNPYKEIILPTLYVEGNINEADEEDNKTSTNYKGTVKIGPLAIFKDATYLTTLSLEESKYLNIMRNNLDNTIITIPYNDGYISLELYSIKTKYKPDIKNNTISLIITGKAKTYEIITNTDIENKDNVEDIQKYFNNYVKDSILNAFNTIRSNYNTDIFNFKDIYHKDNPKYLKHNYTNWYQDTFPNLKLNIISKINLYEKGKIKEEITYVKENR